MRRQTLLLAAALAAACVDKGPSPQGKVIDPAYIQAHLLTEPPAKMANPVNADLGGKVVYLGNDVESTTIAPGAEVKVVHYWKIIQPPGGEWRVFTHLEGTAKKDWMNVDATDMRQGYGPDKWKAGDIIRDEQQFRLREDWSSPTAQLTLGLFRTGGQTAADRMPIVSGPHDDKSRVLAVQFTVSRQAKTKPKTEQPDYVIRRTAGPITIDGRAEEEAWKTAPLSPAFAAAEGGPQEVGETRARMLWDDTHLYVFVQAQDKDVANQYSKQDDPMWKEDVVEIFIDADRNRTGYVELQVNPQNAHFDSYFATTRAQPGDTTWNAEMKSAVVVNGTVNKSGDTDTGWDVEIAIPLAAAKGRNDSMRVRVPPAAGDRWRLNIVHSDKRGDNLAVASWNAIPYADFHALARMLEAVFGDESGGITPPEPAKTEGDQAGGTGTSAPATGTGTSAPATGTGASAPAAPASKPAPSQEPGQGAAAQPGK